MVSLVFVNILQLPHTVISNSEKLTHPTVRVRALLSLLCIKKQPWANFAHCSLQKSERKGFAQVAL